MTRQAIDARVLFPMAVDAPPHVGHVEDLLGDRHRADVTVTRLAPDAGSSVRLVLEVDHGALGDDVDLPPGEWLALTAVVDFHERLDRRDVGSLSTVATRADRHGRQTRLILGLGSQVAAGALHLLVLDMDLVVVGDRLFRRRLGPWGASGEYHRQDRDPEGHELTQTAPGSRHVESRPRMSSDSDLALRLRDLYSGEAGEAWSRLERESPTTYWEENAILGRRDTYELLLERLQPIAGRRVLDAGCGRGLLARRLAAEGALVTGVDLVCHRVLEARGAKGGGAPTFAVADFRDVLPLAGAFDDVVIQEVLEDYTADERRDTIVRLAESRAPRIHLIFRQPGRWGGLIAPMMPDGLIATLDPVPLLRSIHLHTPYRLAYQESIRRRSYSVRWVQLTLEAD